MAENFYLWTVRNSTYTTINSQYKFTVANRPNSFEDGGVTKTYTAGYFKDYKLTFDTHVLGWQEYASSTLFSIAGSSSEWPYNSYSIMMRIYGGNVNFLVWWYGSQTPYNPEIRYLTIPISAVPMHFYFSIEKTNDTFRVKVYSDFTRTNLLASDSIVNWRMAYGDESIVGFAATYARLAGDPTGALITFEVENFEIVSASSSSSISSSSSSRSSSSSSSYSVDPITVINDIGIKDGSYSSSSSSYAIQCATRDLGTDWIVADVSGNPGATWNEVDQRWESVHLYNTYAYLGLSSATEFINEVCTQHFDNTQWTVDTGTWNAGSSRWEPYDYGGFWYLYLFPTGGWDVNPITKVKITVSFPGSSGGIQISSGAGNDLIYPQSDVEYEFVSVDGSHTIGEFIFSSSDANFYITNLVFCTAEKVGWAISETSPNELRFLPVMAAGGSATMGVVAVVLDNSSYALVSYDVPIVSGEEVSLSLSLFNKPRWIAGIYFYIQGNSPYQDYYIEDLYFCGSASSSSSSHSSSSRSSSSSSSSNPTEWDLLEREPLSYNVPVSENGPISGIVSYQFNGNSFQTIRVNSAAKEMYFQEYKDDQWSTKEIIYDLSDSVRGSDPTYSNDGQMISIFNGRPAVVNTYNEYNVDGNTVQQMEFNYKDENGVWQRERLTDGDQNPDTRANQTPGACIFSSDATYAAINYGYQYPNLSIFKRTGDTFARLTTDAPDVVPSSSIYITGSCFAFSPNDEYLACGMNTSPYLWIYKRNGDTFIKLASPLSANPASAPGYISWSSDSLNLCVSHSTSPRITMYQRSGDTFTKSSNPGTVPASTPSNVLYSPDTNYLAVKTDSSPYFYMYSRSGNTYTKLADLVDPLPSQTHMTWAADSSYMVFVRNVFSYEEHILVYTNSGGVLTKQNTPYATLFNVKPRAGTYTYVKSAKITPDGQLLICAMEQQPPLCVYQISAGPIFTLVPSLNETFLFGGAPTDIRQYNISGDSQYVSLITSGGNSCVIYKRNGTAFNLISNIGGISPSGYGLILLARQSSNGDFHVIVKDSWFYFHLIRDFGTGQWSKTYIGPTVNVGFWEWQLDISSYKPRCKMDSDGYIHLVYYKAYYQMPTTGSNPTTYYKLMYATNRTGSWTGSEVYNFTGGMTSAAPALAIDTDGTVYVLGTVYSSGYKGMMCKLPVGGSWQTQIISPWNTDWQYNNQGAIHGTEFHAIGYYRYLVFDTTTLALIKSYAPSELQKDSYPTGDYYYENLKDYWENLDGSDIRIRIIEPNPYYYQKIYQIEFSASSSSRSSTSRVSSSSSSSSLNEPDDLWNHNITSGLHSYGTPYDIIKDPNSNAIHAFVDSRWMRKDDVTTSDSWVIDDSAGTLSHSAYQASIKMFISPSTNTRYVVFYSNNAVYLVSRAQGATTWSSTTIQAATMYGFGADMVEDSSGYLHILYSQRIYGNLYNYTPYVTKIRHAHNTSGSWVIEDIYTTSNVYSDSPEIYGVSAVILPDNTIHCAFTERMTGLTHVYGTTGSWTANTIISVPTYNDLIQYSSVKLVKDSTNNVHMAVMCRYSHLYLSVYMIEYGKFNGTSWTLEKDVTGSKSYTSTSSYAYDRDIALILDSTDKPHIIVKDNGYIAEWVKNTYWEYVCKESMTINNTANIVGCYSNGYLNVLSRSSTAVVLYSKRLVS